MSSVTRELWGRLGREAKVALRTFGVAWLLFSTALLTWSLFQPPRPSGFVDVALGLSVGFVVCAVYAFWPACLVTLARVVYRVLGWGAYAGALVILAGSATSLYLWRHVLGRLLFEILAGAGALGPCGGHAGGPAAVLALACLVAAMLSSPASLWALFKLCLALSAAVALGALPGALVWLLLLFRWAAKLASGRVSR